jgi:hypothetical protein
MKPVTVKILIGIANSVLPVTFGKEDRLVLRSMSRKMHPGG